MSWIIWDREQETLASTSVFPNKGSAEAGVTRLVANFPNVDSNESGRFLVVELPADA